MNLSWREKLSQLYAEVDAAVQAAGPRCDQSGRCCRFTEWGHVVFLSSWEAEYLLESAPPYSQPVGPDGCPFQVNRLCTAREARPLGCRIYFCDPTYQETGNRIMEEAIARLKRLTEEAGASWHYAPLHHFLNNPPGDPPRQSSAARISLLLTSGSSEPHPGERVAERAGREVAGK